MLKNQRGQATVEFLIISLLLFAILFGAVDYWGCMVRIQQAEHVKNYYLDRVRLEGCLTDSDKSALKTRLEELGFVVDGDGINAPTEAERVTRNISFDVNNPGDYPEVWLDITTEFKNNPFMLGVFLGRENNLKPKFSGKVLSEYAGP